MPAYVCTFVLKFDMCALVICVCVCACVCVCVCTCRSDPDTVESCTSSKISENATFPSVWGWLQEGAQFEVYSERGTNKTYPSWKLHVRTKIKGQFIFAWIGY